MSRREAYQEFYLSKRVTERLGTGRKMWMLRLPQRVEGANSSDLLGSILAEEDFIINRRNYPVPLSVTTPRIVQKKLAELREPLGLPDGIVLKQTLSGVTFTMTRSRGLQVAGGVNFPGYAAALDLGISRSSIKEIEVGFSNESFDAYIPTEYLNRLAKHHGGNPRRAFPDLALDVADYLICHEVIVAKNYKLSIKTDDKLDVDFEAKATAEIAEGNAKVAIKRQTETSFSIDVQDDQYYTIGIKTLDWDDLDYPD